MTLATPLGAHRLSAKYDLLALEPGRRAVIVDWKTERKRPTRVQLAARMQTRVYRYVLVEAGAALNGGHPIEPEQVTLVYWFAEFPAEPEVLPYDSAQHADDAAFLARLVDDIAARTEAEWPKTNKKCAASTARIVHCATGASPPAQATKATWNSTWRLTLAEVEEIAY